MPNPFEHLNVQCQFPPREPTPQTAPEFLHEPSSPIICIASRYDDMVLTVLTQLAEVAYPNYGIRCHSKKPKYGYYTEFDSHPVWSIGQEHYSSITGAGRTQSIRELCIHWEYAVAVKLILRHTDDPILFECVRGGYYWTEPQGEDRSKDSYIVKEMPSIQCELSEQELVKTLIRLHPEWASPKIQKMRRDIARRNRESKQ